MHVMDDDNGIISSTLYLSGCIVHMYILARAIPMFTIKAGM